MCYMEIGSHSCVLTLYNILDKVKKKKKKIDKPNIEHGFAVIFLFILCHFTVSNCY